jgi:type IV pilus assembly protein PilF
MRFPNSVERIQLNHYFCRSREEFESKLVRGRGDGGQAYDFERFNRYDRAATIEDSCIINLVSQLVDHFTVGADPKEWVVDALSRTLKRIEIPRVTQIQSQTTAIERYDIKEFIREHDYLLYGKNVDPQYRESQLKRLLAAYPTAIPFYMSLAEHYIDLGRLESAWELLAKAWKLAPNSLSVLMSMGKYFLASQDFDHAEKTYRLAQALDPDGFDLCCQLGRVLMLKGKMQVGAELIANAIEKIPEAANEEGMADLIRKIGIFFYQNRDIKRAQALLKIVMKFNPRDYETFIALGKISFDQKQFQNARKYLKQAQQIDPDGEEAKLGLKLLSHKS